MSLLVIFSIDKNSADGWDAALLMPFSYMTRIRHNAKAGARRLDTRFGHFTAVGRTQCHLYLITK